MRGASSENIRLEFLTKAPSANLFVDDELSQVYAIPTTGFLCVRLFLFLVLWDHSCVVSFSFPYSFASIWFLWLFIFG